MTKTVVRIGQVAFLVITALLTAACTPIAVRDSISGHDARNRGDCQKAIQLYTKAYEEGKGQMWSWGNGVSDAQVPASSLGHMYAAGTCVPYNRALARMWYEREALEPGWGNKEDLACMDDPSSSNCIAVRNGDQQISNMLVAQIQAQSTYPQPRYAVTNPPVIENSPTVTAGAPSYAYDSNLNQCVHLVSDNQQGAEMYFQNNCGLPVTIIFFQPGGGSPGTTSCNPGTHCMVSIYGIGYTSHKGTYYAACPKDDYIETSPGHQWSGSGSFSCRRP